ncbi:MAG: hypothetical protein HY303_18675 [Candidatus Wallbacteria bacterium]|nr:hypothetical protein [Candidatus Wallbacteria bacterium]
MFWAATTYFGSWAQSLQAAGIPEGMHGVVRRHTPDSVLAQIQFLIRRDQSLKTSALKRRGYGWLVAAARKLFGTWSGARRAAGARLEPNRRHRGGTGGVSIRTESEVLEAIWRRLGVGLPVNARSVELLAPGLFLAGRRLFGNWSAALESAGMDPKTVGAYPKWTRESFADAVHRLQSQGRPLGVGSVLRFERRLLGAAVKLYGSWKKGLEALGFDYETIRKGPIWTREHIVETLRRFDREGQSLYPVDLRREHGSMLVAAARGFGSYAAALAAAGMGDRVAGRKRTVWTRQWIEQEVARLKAEGKQPSGDCHPRLKAALTYHYGSLTAGLAAYGWRPAKTGPRPKVARLAPGADRPSPAPPTGTAPASTLAAPVAGRSGESAEAGGVVAGAATRREPTRGPNAQWKSGTTDSVRFRSDRPKRTYTRWTRELVLKRIRERLLAGLSLEVDDVQCQEGGLYSAANKLGLSWGEAKKAAGVPQRAFGRSAEATPEGVLEVIRCLYDHGGPLAVQTLHSAGLKSLLRAVTRFFGDWARAVEAAGLSAVAKPEDEMEDAGPGPAWYLTKESVLDAIRERHRLKLPMKRRDLLREADSLVDAAARHFRSWGRALQCAGVPAQPGVRPPPLTRRAMVAALRALEARGVSLTYRSVSKADQTLARVICQRFGDWELALRRLGLGQECRPPRLSRNLPAPAIAPMP